MVTPLMLICRSLVVGGLAGARPILTLFLLQLYFVFLADGSTIPESYQWILHEYSIIIAAALAVVEHFIRTDPDFEELLALPNGIMGVAVASLLAVLMTAFNNAPPPELFDQETQNAGIFDVFWGPEGLSLLFSIVAAVILLLIRRHIIRTLGSLSVSQRYFRWLETGVIVGSVTVLVLLPFLTVVLAIVILVGSSIIGATLWFVQKQTDGAFRTDCPKCKHGVRKEALLCPKCGEDLEPSIKLGQLSPSGQED